MIDDAERQQIDCLIVQRGPRAPPTLQQIGARHPRERQRVRAVTCDVGGGERANLSTLATGDIKQTTQHT
ncbi:hypothetical protein SAMN05216382_1055 [Sphingomonas palmae]|uniref:Uncharacterized protein n=1 Tax=Sphingomonas palmae TaxID=1855283 RepID=A0A1H7KR71_9SPHN|nr:hypothetical protein SAMN05216382_1055 [Sphingomonas palmae]